MYSAVIDPTGGYAYFGTNTAPGTVVKIRLSDFTRVGALTMNSGENSLISGAIDTTGGYAYFGTNTSPGGVVKVRLSDFIRVGALTFNSGENQPGSAVIDQSAGYVYFGTSNSPGRIVKVRLSDFTRVDALTLNADEYPLYSAVIDTTRGFIYLGTYTSPAKVVKVRLSDFTRADALTLNSGENGIFSEVIDTTGGYAYFGLDTSPGIVIKMDITLSPPTVTTNAATSITSNSATLNGTVNANNLSTAVTFQYGLDTNYGSTVIASPSPVTGSSNTTVSAAITGLSPNTTYHFRVVGVSSDGTTNGSDLTFTTLALPNVYDWLWENPLPQGNTLNGLACPSSMLCKAVGTGGTIVSWNGTSWSADSSGTTDSLNAIACPSATLCKAVSNNGAIRSWNGTSWGADSSGSAQSLYGIACPSATLCKAVGSSGTILGMVGQYHNNVSAGFALDIFNSPGCLNGITVSEFQTNHPNASTSHQTGRYWTITASGCSSGFSGSMTLPATFTPSSGSKVCRYTGSGTTWDCATNGYSTSPNNTVTREGITQFSDWAVGDFAPTAATLVNFNAKLAPKKSVVRVKWETGSELNVLGFNVWRKVGKGKWEIHNTELIPAKNVGSIQGAKYAAKHKKVKAGKTYRYKIEIIKADGSNEWSEVQRVNLE